MFSTLTEAVWHVQPVRLPAYIMSLSASLTVSVYVQHTHRSSLARPACTPSCEESSLSTHPPELAAQLCISSYASQPTTVSVQCFIMFTANNSEWAMLHNVSLVHMTCFIIKLHGFTLVQFVLSLTLRVQYHYCIKRRRSLSMLRMKK